MVRCKDLKTMAESFDIKLEAKKWSTILERKLDKGKTTDFFQASNLLRGNIFR